MIHCYRDQPSHNRPDMVREPREDNKRRNSIRLFAREMCFHKTINKMKK